MNEIEIIRLFYPSCSYPEDDCFFDKEGELAKSSTLVTTDGMASGVHFHTDWSSPEDIAVKLVEVNVSDLVSSGGIGKFAFLNLGLSQSTARPDWIQRFASALRKRLELYKIRLAGGDSFRVEGNQTVLSLTLIGNLHPELRNPFLRSGGCPGDRIFLSGPVGYSQLGLEQLIRGTLPTDEIGIRAETKHKRPASRFDLLDPMVGLPIHACMDCTDGLVQDLLKLSQASRLGMRIFIENLPEYSTLITRLGRNEILTSGEELELLVLAPASAMDSLLRIGFSWIGDTFSCEREPIGLVEFFENGEPVTITNPGFRHFE